ncbi:MAG TPA: imidazole glycerol phosphate synthase cyclase subunit [Sneathiellales bacterium]|nr:imidazole glycerol phosphate synthase cyclase subunit [Sneathiellales bacterium]
MLRKRLITVLTFNDGVLFRTKLFNPDYRYTLNFVDAWSVDEIVVLDVTRPGQGRRENFDHVVKRFASQCFVPLSAGGGIRTLDDVKAYLDLGADKVIINTEALRRPAFIGEIAKLYGSQCVVVSIDAKKHGESGYEVYGEFATAASGMTPAEWARRAQDEGAGEILITAVEKDGSVQGYDLDLCRLTSDAVTIPVLICGGAGNWKHFVDGFAKGGASAVCTANIYHFTEASIKSAKSFLGKAGIDVRE